MEYKKISDKTSKVANEIINMQYDDNKKHGIHNHFLENVINEMILLQAPKIKSYVDFIFDDAKKNNVKENDDIHSLVCKILLNTDQKSVFTISDESSYGPDMNKIIVIDNKEKGSLHIRKINDSAHLKKYKNSKYEIEDCSFIEKDFVLTFHYMGEFSKSLLKMSDKIKDKKEIEYLLKKMQQIEKMGDRTFELYERVVYSTGLMASINNFIKQ